MWHAVSNAIKDLRRKFLILFSFGRVTNFLAKGSFLTKVQLNSGEIFSLPRFEFYGLSHNPKSGRVIGVFPDGDRSLGWVMCSSNDSSFLNLDSDDVALYDARRRALLLDQYGVCFQSQFDAQARPKESSFFIQHQKKQWMSMTNSGTQIRYNRTKINISDQGIFLESLDDSPIEIKSKKLVVHGALHVKGDIESDRNIKDAAGSLDQLRQKYQLHQHIADGSPTSSPV